MKIRYSDIFDQIVENAISQRISSTRSYRDFAFQQLELARGIPTAKLYETFELFVRTRPLERVRTAILESQSLEEYVVDRIKHPKYGDVAWDNTNGVNTIQNNNRTAYRGSHQEVASQWQQLKQSVSGGGNYQSNTPDPEDMRIVDKLHHPKYGDLFWVEADSVNYIHHDGKVTFKGTRADVQRRWKEIKSTVQTSSQFAESQSLEEYVVDRIKHPKYGDVAWDNTNGVNTIQNNNRTAYRGSHQEVASQWQQLKRSGGGNQQSNTHDPEDMRIVDKLHHPKYGDLFWVEADSVNYIHHDGKVTFKGTRADVQRRWKEIKSTVQTFGSSDRSNQFNVQESETTKSMARDVKKQEGPDFSWISNFDVKEVSKAVGVIVDYLGQRLDDPQQVNVLRNDIRLLDNFMTAVRSKDSNKIMQSWVIAREQGATDHLHDEFVTRMENAVGRRVNNEGLVFNNYNKWKSLVEDIGYKITESYNSKVATDPLSGMMVGYWTEHSGWLLDLTDNTSPSVTLTERAPPGEEAWIKTNKSKFIDQYGDSKGLHMLYATAWRRYNKANKPDSDSSKK